MAMDATVLGQAMASALGVTDAAVVADMTKVAGAIIAHIQTQATITVTTTIAGGSVATGVTAGAAAVPVTGTTTGTATIR